MKRLLSALILMGLIASLLCGAFAATKVFEPDENGRDYGSEGWYTVYSIVPENHDYSYIYDQPSSSKGKNLCRADDGEEVYVYFTVQYPDSGATWAYCSYDSETKGTTFEGYIRYSNLLEQSEYAFREPKPTLKPTPKPTPKPTVSPTATPQIQNNGAAMGMPLLETLTVVNCDEWVSLREQPNSESARLIKVPKGTQVVGYYYNKRWYACNYAGLFGYIDSDFLE